MSKYKKIFSVVSILQISMLIALNYCTSCITSTKTDIKLVLTELDTVNTDNKIIYNRVDYFLINNDIYFTGEVHSDVYKFVKSHLGNLPKQYTNYRMLFYKKTNDLNLKEIQTTTEEHKWTLFRYEKPFDEYRYFLGQLIH